MKQILALFACILAFATMIASGAQAQSAYKIRAGDVLRIEVLEDQTLNRQSLVPPDGRITLPLAGSIAAAGRTIEDIQKDLISRLTPSFAAAPTVFVSIESIFVDPLANQPALPDLIKIYVQGEVAKQGRIDVLRGTTILQFFAEMGGFSKFAAIKRIQLRRVDKNGVEKVYGINYQDIESGRSSVGKTVLSEGDVIIVPQRKLFE